jgi:hypothetical protein
MQRDDSRIEDDIMGASLSGPIYLEKKSMSMSRVGNIFVRKSGGLGGILGESSLFIRAMLSKSEQKGLQ